MSNLNHDLQSQSRSPISIMISNHNLGLQSQSQPQSQSQSECVNLNVWQAVMTGQALAGLCVALVSFATIWVEPPHADSAAIVSHGAFHYFLATIAVLAMCVGSYFLLHTLPFFQFHHQKSLEETKQHALLAALLAEGNRDNSVSQENGGSLRRPLLADGSFPPSAPSSVMSDSLDHGGRGGNGFSPTRIYRIALILNFTVTLGVFPGITSMVTSAAPHPGGLLLDRLTTDLFAPLVYVVFNAGDFSGRAATSLGPKRPPPPLAMLLAACVRTALIPLVLFCNVNPSGAKTWNLPILIASDTMFFAVVALIGLSNGYVGAIMLRAILVI
jgi:equilibrative nucleoside transporter 1/2/3